MKHQTLSEQESLNEELKKLLTDKFLDKLAIAVCVIADIENRTAIERFVYKVYEIAGKQPPNLTPYISRERLHCSDEDIRYNALLMKGFL